MNDVRCELARWAMELSPIPARDVQSLFIAAEAVATTGVVVLLVFELRDSLVRGFEVHSQFNQDELRIELKGNLAAMLGAAQNAKRSPETGCPFGKPA